MLAGIVSMLVDKHSFYDHLKMEYLREEAGTAPGGGMTVDG
jgi:hypothetical protein